MPIPASYTESTLASYMDSVIGSLADVLGWANSSSDYDEAVTDTLLAYGVDDIANATDMRKLRTLARRAVWQAAVNALVAGDFDKTAESGASLSLSQRLTNAEARLVEATNEASVYDASYGVQRRSIVRSYDPYTVLNDSERTP